MRAARAAAGALAVLAALLPLAALVFQPARADGQPPPTPSPPDHQASPPASASPPTASAVGGVALFAEEDFRGREVRLSLGAGTQRKRFTYDQLKRLQMPAHPRSAILQPSVRLLLEFSDGSQQIYYASLRALAPLPSRPASSPPSSGDPEEVHLDSVVVDRLPMPISTWHQHRSDPALVGSLPAAATLPGIVLFTQSDFSGPSQFVPAPADLDVGQLLANDAISSIRVPSGLRVTAFSDHRWTGRQIVCRGDCTLQGRDDDAISSLRVELAPGDAEEGGTHHPRSQGPPPDGASSADSGHCSAADGGCGPATPSLPGAITVSTMTAGCLDAASPQAGSRPRVKLCATSHTSPSAATQQWVQTAGGRLQLADTELCLASDPDARPPVVELQSCSSPQALVLLLTASGQLHITGSDECLDANPRNALSLEIRRAPCDGEFKTRFAAPFLRRAHAASDAARPAPSAQFLLRLAARDASHRQICLQPGPALGDTPPAVLSAPCSIERSEQLWDTPSGCRLLRNARADLCITTDEKTGGASLFLRTCSCTDLNQQFFFLGRQIVLASTAAHSLCIDAEASDGTEARVWRCRAQDGRQQQFDPPKTTRPAAALNEERLRVLDELHRENERLRRALENNDPAAPTPSPTPPPPPPNTGDPNPNPAPAPAPTPPPPPGRAVLFTDHNMEGRSFVVQSGEPVSLADHSFAAETSSLRVDPGFRLSLYTNSDCTGLRFQANGPLRDLASYSFNDKAACAHVEPESNPLDGITVYSDSDFSGESQFLPARPMPGFYEYAAPDLLLIKKISSARIPAGVKAVFYTSDKFSERAVARETHVSNFEHLGLNDAVQSVVVTAVPLDKLSGAILYPDAQFAGEGMFLKPGRHPSLPGLANLASSLRLSPGFVVHMYSHAGFQGTNWKATGNVADFSTIANLNDNVESIDVVPVCSPPCQAHGKCMGNNVCRCEPGWGGALCEHGPPDTSSTVVCAANFVFVGEMVECVLTPRRRGLAVPSPAKWFRLGESIEADGAEKSLPRGSLLEPLDDKGAVLPGEQPLASSFRFQLRPIAASPSPQTLFRLEVAQDIAAHSEASGGSNHASVYLPQLQALALPDATSSVSCDKAEVVRGELVTCRIHPREAGRDIVTSLRAFEVTVRGLGRLASALRVASAAETDSAASPAATPSTEAGRAFVFGYVPQTGGRQPHAHFDVWVLGGRLGVEGAGGDLQLPAANVPGLALVHPANDDLLGQAKALIYLQDFPAALALLDRQANSTGGRGSPQLHWLRARLRLLHGQFAAASQDLRVVEGAETKEGKRKVRELRSLSRRGHSSQQAGLHAHALGQHALAVAHLTAALEVAKESAFLHLLRADAGLQMDNYMLVRYDTAMVLRRNPRSARALYLLGMAQFQIVGQPEAALANLRHCLLVAEGGQDDHGRKQCREGLATIERVVALERGSKSNEGGGNYTAAVQDAEAQLKLDPRSNLARAARRRLCALQFQLKQALATEAACSQAIRELDDMDSLASIEGGVELFLYRAWARFSLQDYDRALKDIQEALQAGADPAKALPLRKLIQEAIENDGKKDYYKILGLEKDATTAEIRSAYRRLAREMHPDKSEHPNAARIFMDIVEAYEVLMDKELRAKYDGGEDIRAERNKREPAFKFHYDPRNVKNGKVKAWFVNPETGEKEEVDLDLGGGGQSGSGQSGSGAGNAGQDGQGGETEEPRPPLPKHCCLEAAA